MIIWLASYPKSGNTWIRALLTTLLYSKDSKCNFKNLSLIEQYPKRKHYEDFINNFQDFNQIKKAWIASQNKINLDQKLKILKTHHVNCKIGQYPFTSKSNTLGVIHIVRDPRNVVTSIKNHFSKGDYTEALKFITNENKVITNDWDVSTLISSWKTNYISWKAVSKNYLLIKYEDLLLNLEKEFIKIINFLAKFEQINFEKNKIKEAISSSSFENFKKMEKDGSFKESATNKDTGQKKNFFYLGPNNDWKKLLDNNIRQEIEKKFKKEMQYLGYL